ncbi:MAG TPA: tetratricopeptide repeat protein, partial [Myxococcaceae bacterium]
MTGRGRQRGGRRLPLVAAGCALLASAVASARPIAFGEAVEDAVRPGEVRAFELAAAGGTALHLRVDHPHLDLGVRAIGPDGAVAGGMENVLRSSDPLTLTVVLDRPGTYRLEVFLRSPDARGGRFRLALGPAAPATATDGLRMEAQRLRAEANAWVAAQDGARYSAALAGYDRSLQLWTEARDETQRAETLSRKGELLEMMARLPEARTTLEDALRSWRTVGDWAREADCQGVLGLVVTELGAPRDAIILLEQALALRRSVAPLPVAEAILLNFHAVALGNLGDLAGAVDRYTEALTSAREDGDRELIALVLKNRAMDLDQLGESERVLTDLSEARDTFQALGNAGEEGASDYGLGIALEHLGRREESWRAFERALPLLSRSGDERFVAFTFDHMGLLRLDEQRPDEARDLLQEALRRLEAGGDRRSAINARVALAQTLVESGRAREALQPLATSRAELHAIGDRVNEASCLTALA